MKTSVLLLSLLAATPQVEAPCVTSADMELLIGVRWEGELTYINGSDNRSVTIPAALSVTRQAEDQYVFAFTCPHEPEADRTTVLAIEKDGTVFGGETVVSKERLEDGSVKVTTTEGGTDDGKDATFLFTYVIGPSRFSTRRTATHAGEEDSLFRNGYTFTNKGTAE